MSRAVYGVPTVFPPTRELGSRVFPVSVAAVAQPQPAIRPAVNKPQDYDEQRNLSRTGFVARTNPAAVAPLYGRAFSYDEARNPTRLYEFPAPVVVGPQPAVTPFYGKDFDWRTVQDPSSRLLSGLAAAIFVPPQLPAIKPLYGVDKGWEVVQDPISRLLFGVVLPPPVFDSLPETTGAVWEEFDEVLPSRSYFVAPFVTPPQFPVIRPLYGKDFDWVPLVAPVSSVQGGHNPLTVAPAAGTPPFDPNYFLLIHS